jgi:hypothetical protein
MNARKTFFVITGMALLTVSSLFSPNQHQKSTPTPSIIADGTAPLPPIPTKGSVRSAAGGSVLVADGTAPLPPIPTKGSVRSAAGGSVLVVDATAPLLPIPQNRGEFHIA